MQVTMRFRMAKTIGVLFTGPRRIENERGIVKGKEKKVVLSSLKGQVDMGGANNGRFAEEG